ncbi:IS66 family transposase [Candidatus Scalindua japonica]|nr:IS66 family transposase [Candidatus Scalindua japonica]
MKNLTGKPSLKGVKRRRYTLTCSCNCNPGIITAKGPDKLISGGGYAISFWIKVFLDKYRWQTPTNRLREELEKFQLFVSQGSITGGFQFISGLLKPIEDEIINKNKTETHWHCDETRWMVFVNMPEKKNHKWYLWIYQSATTVVFLLVPSRGAKVPKEHFENNASGIISADRYVAYKCMIKSGNFLVAFCWAHVRRDFLDLAVKWPELEAWALVWVGKIADIYPINNQRMEFDRDSLEFTELDLKLRNSIEQMENDHEQELSKTNLHCACGAVLNSLKNHWNGLILFIDYPWIPMDNNIAERGLRNPIMGRKSYYGSGALWSAELAARSFTINQTLELWGINLYLWYYTYFKECAKYKSKTPNNIQKFLPWNMTDQQLISFGADPKKVPIPPPKINRDIYDKKQNRDEPSHIYLHTLTQMDRAYY